MNSRDLTDPSGPLVGWPFNSRALIVILFTILGGVVFFIVSASQAEATQRAWWVRH